MTSEMPILFRQASRVARKEHACVECRNRIEPREKYHDCSGLWVDGWDSYKICDLCEDLRTRLFSEHSPEMFPDEMPGFGYVLEFFYDCGCEFCEFEKVLFLSRTRVLGRASC